MIDKVNVSGLDHVFSEYIPNAFIKAASEKAI